MDKLTKNEISDIINDRLFRHTINPYYNERKADGFKLQIVEMSDKISACVYLNLNDDFVITSINNHAKKDVDFDELVGHEIDKSTFNGKKIRGNWEDTVGEVEDGKFILDDIYTLE